jgi:hypothetical protein
LTSLPLIQKLSPVITRFPAGTTRVSRPLRPVVLVAGCIALAAGCSLHPAVKPVPPTQQQLQAYATEQTALRDEASGYNEAPREYCDQLAAATPGVEELRINHGVVESRQWTLVANGPARHWVFVRPVDSAADGWAPKPGLDNLDFQPPVEAALTPGSSHFIAYAPIERDTLEDSQRSAAAREAFGAAQGEFTWRGRKYSYTVTPGLPCFPVLQ